MVNETNFDESLERETFVGIGPTDIHETKLTDGELDIEGEDEIEVDIDYRKLEIANRNTMIDLPTMETYQSFEAEIDLSELEEPQRASEVYKAGPTGVEKIEVNLPVKQFTAKWYDSPEFSESKAELEQRGINLADVHVDGKGSLKDLLTTERMYFNVASDYVGNKLIALTVDGTRKSLIGRRKLELTILDSERALVGSGNLDSLRKYLQGE